MTVPLDFLLDLWDVFLLIFIRMTVRKWQRPSFGCATYLAHTRSDSPLCNYCFYILPAPEFVTFIVCFFFLIMSSHRSVLGYISYLVITAIYLAGQMIDMHIGFGMVSVFDPMSNIQIPITANFYFILTMLMFLAIDGHHLLIYTLADSYIMLPLGSSLVFDQTMIDFLLRLFGSVFVISFKIAAPVTAAIFIADVSLGVISKAVPQVNVFVIGLPLKVFLGLLVIFFTITAFRNIVHILMGGMQDEMVRFMEILGGGV